MWVYIPGRLSEQMEHQCLRSGRCALTARQHGYQLVVGEGIENFRFHDLRHTWASRLIPSGVPLSVLQEMGGWESREMVRRYAHLAPNHLTEHARKIDDIFGDNVRLWNYRRNKEGVTD